MRSSRFGTALILFVLLTNWPSLASAGEYISFQVPGSFITVPVAISESGLVTGVTQNSDGQINVFVGDPEGTLDLVSLPGSWSLTPRDIARDGTSVGILEGSDGTQGYIIYPDKTVEILSSPYQYLMALGINDRGVVVGMEANLEDFSAWGFLLDTRGDYTTVEVPGALQTMVMAINGAGLSAGLWGEYEDDGSTKIGLFVRSKSGALELFDIPGVPAEASLAVKEVTDTGVVVGTAAWWGLDGNAVYVGFQRTRGGVVSTFTLLEVDGTEGDVEVGGANARGDIVGRFYGTGGFIRDRNGNVEFLNAPDSYPNQTIATDINNQGVTTGYHATADGTSFRGFIYR